MKAGGFMVEKLRKIMKAFEYERIVGKTQKMLPVISMVHDTTVQYTHIYMYDRTNIR